MINLLRSDFYKLFRKKSFYICGIISAALTWMIVFSVNWILTTASGQPLEGGSAIDALCLSFTELSLLPVVLAILMSILISNEFSQGTIKNIASRGVGRAKIYLSKLIVGIFAEVIYAILVGTVGFITGYILWGKGEVTNEIVINILKSLGLFLLALMAFMSISIMVSFIVRSTGGAVAINLCLFMFMRKVIDLISILAKRAFHAADDFDANKYYLDNYMWIGYDKISDEFLRTGIIVCLVYLVVSTIVGIYTFKKRDIK